MFNCSLDQVALSDASGSPVPSDRPGKVYVGCAGWGLSSAVADWFPSEGTHLQRYARVFSAVEINSSFYRPHRASTYAKWHDSVPVDFRFSVKIPRTITHEQRLRDVGQALDRFVDETGGLGGKLGCFLLQLPPSLRFDAPEADAFLRELRRRSAIPVVCEPRHVSWFTAAAAQCLAAHEVACVHAHPLPIPAVEPPGGGQRLYIRLHGAPRIYYSAYDTAFLTGVADRIARARQSGQDAWCVFDNTAQGEAVPNALWLMQRLAGMGEIPAPGSAMGSATTA